MFQCFSHAVEQYLGVWHYLVMAAPAAAELQFNFLLSDNVKTTQSAAWANFKKISIQYNLIMYDWGFKIGIPQLLSISQSTSETVSSAGCQL